MTANGRTRETARHTTMAFRHLMSRRRLLEAIQHERGHLDLSETLREAADEYIERYLRSGEQAA